MNKKIKIDTNLNLIRSSTKYNLVFKEMNETEKKDLIANSKERIFKIIKDIETGEKRRNFPLYKKYDIRFQFRNGFINKIIIGKGLMQSPKVRKKIEDKLKSKKLYEFGL